MNSTHATESIDGLRGAVCDQIALRRERHRDGPQALTESEVGWVISSTTPTPPCRRGTAKNIAGTFEEIGISGDRDVGEVQGVR